jgi:cytochrome c-type biogenesis protein CcmH/NrfG
MTFKIEAMAVTETEDGKRARVMWEKMHRAIKRNERRQQREERLKAKKELEEGRVRDEL